MSATSTLALRAPPAADLTASRIARAMLAGALLWLLAALFIHYLGPRGAFEGWRLPLTYAGTVLVTIRSNIACRRLAGLGADQALTVVAIGSATALFMDVVAFAWPDRIYGSDPAVLLGGAVWLLFAIGVALGLALLTTQRARTAP